jgi:hypothetical protein
MSGAGGLSPFLRAKHAWDSDDTDEAQRILNLLLAPPEGGPAIWVGSHMVAAFAPGPFESFVVRLASSDDLLVPFHDYIEKLWNALPAQYIIQALELRQSDVSDLDERPLDLVYQAAADGLLSTQIEDYRRLCWVVLRPEDYPHLTEVVDWSRLEALLQNAQTRGAREAFARGHPEVIANMILYGAFHRTKALYPDEVIYTLTQFAESDPELLELTAITLAEWVDRQDADEIVRAGLRCQDGSPESLKSLATALANSAFDDFVERCFIN